MESSNVDDKNTRDKETEDVTQEGLEDISEEEEGDEKGEEDDDDDGEDDWESDEEGDDDVGSDEGNDDEDNDEDDDDEEEDEEEEEAVLEASDSDAEDTERCPICLDRFRDQDVGTPESCDHTFCLECITEWSKNVNTCPADRRVFRLILCKHGLDDPIYKKIPVEDINLQQDEEEEDDPVYCEVCHQSNHEDRLLLCDGCDEGYHLECLTPPLTQVPVEEWFCPRCSRREEHDPDYVHTVSSHHRRIARTLVSERVRSAIEEIRVRRARSMRQLVSSDEEEEEDSSSAATTTAVDSTSSSSPAKKTPVRKTPAKRKTPRKYKKRRKTKRKTRKRKTSKKTSGTTPKGKKTKRKGGRRRKKRKTPKKLARTAKPMPITTPKTRIADALGLSKPPPGRTIPMQKLKQEKSLDMKRGDIGADSLSIFGSKDELIHFEDDQAEEQPSGSSAGTSKYSRLSLSSYKPIGRVPVLPAVRKKKKIVIKTEPAAASGSALDLLGSIMRCQDRLNMSSKDVTIHRDGSLTTKPIESQQSKSASNSSSISPGSSLFKSSFMAVDKSVDKQASILTSLTTTEKGRSQSPEKLAELNEEYDPANPTEDLDENMGKSEDNIIESEDVYDPAHPTDDLSSEEERLTSDKKEKTAATVENIKDEHVLHGNKNEQEKAKTDKFKLDQRSTKIEFSFKTGINIDKNKKKTPEKEEIKIKVENGKVDETEKNKEKSVTEDKTAAVNKSSITASNVKTSPEKLDSSKKVQIHVQKTPEKAPVPGSSEKESLFKKSPSVKITETSKKSAAVVKPFEISRKTLFEKKRLYGGEIDFSEDVDFSEGAFPETFEINAKRIEEVFKGTLKKPEPKLVEPETKVLNKPQVLSNENTCTLNVLDKDNKVVNSETNSIETVKPSEEIIDKSKQIAKAADKEKSVNLKEISERNKEEIGSEKLAKEKVHIEPKDKNKEISDNTKENVSRSEDKSKEKFKVQKTNEDDKSKLKSIKESKDKIKITVEKSKSKTDENDDYTGITKLSVSDRFKKIKSDKKTQDAGPLEEEDPIHEMRKLDKELELEFGKTAFSKKKDTKKTKRKVSLDDLEKENLRIRRDSKENKEKRKLESRHSHDDREEGEVDDDIRLKDKKKKDKKRRKSEKDLYYGDDYLEPGESDIDRRIVIQVSQNNEDRTVWEEAERQRRKREDRKKEKERHKDSDKDTKKEKKLKRQRSCSRSHEKRIRSRSRDRRRSKSWSLERQRSRERDRSRHRDRSRDRSRSKDRDKSRERARRKRKERVRSQSRDRSVERSRKKKKRNRSRDRERELSKGWSPSRSKDRDWSRERDLSLERSRDHSQGRSRDRKRSREHSEERVDMFGRSKSPYIRKEHIKEKKNSTPRKKPKKERFDPDEVIILDSPPPPKEPTYEEVSSSESEKDSPETARNIENMGTFSRPKSKERIETVPRVESKGRVEAIARIEAIDRRPRDSSPELANDKDEEDDDEPEETEQFQYTDREEFLGQNTSKQMRQNLITIGVNHSDLAKNSVPTPPPLPEPLNTPTPPLPPALGDFNHFPPPPPGPPPQGPPPGTVIIQERPLHIQGPPGQGILGEGPILVQGPPPLESGPPPGVIQQRPVPVNINVLPPGFHRGLPPTITSQRQVLVSPIRQSAPRLQRLASPAGVRLSWQVNTTEIMPGQFGPGVASPGRLPGHPVINGPFEGLPPPHSESLPPHSLPPGHLNFPPPSLAPGEPASHVIAIKTNTPPPNIVQIPVEVNEANRHLAPVVPESQHLHLGPDPRIPPPRLPIPLLPTVSEPPPMSIMVSMPPPSSGMMSMPPPGSVQEPFPRTGTPPNSVSAIIGLARLGAGAMPSVTPSLIPGLQMATSSAGISTGEMSNVSTSQSTLSELEKISELLNTQAHLMIVAKDIKQSGTAGKVKGDTLFKVPLAPAGKMGSKNGVDATEVVDMEIGSPINEEGNIELPVSPQFDNLIDNPEDLLEEDFNKKMKELLEKAKSALSNNEEQKVVTPTKNKKVKEVKDQEVKKDSPTKPKEEKHKQSSKENKHGHHHKHRKHRTKPDAEKDLKEKALKDAHLDLDTQEVPSSAVDMTNKEKYLKKLHLQERVVEEVKMAIKPFYSNKEITKEQYKEVLRKAVPKICHSKSGNINPMKIKNLVEAYVEKYKKHSNHNHTPNKQQDISPGFDDIVGLNTTKTAR